MLRRKNFSVLIKGKNITITVTTEDIIDSKGNIVIAGSDTFDTELGEIISPDSLIGQVITEVYNSNKGEIDNDISNSLANINYQTDATKTFGKKKSLPFWNNRCVIEKQ